MMPKIFNAVILLCVVTLFVSFDLPKGWLISGSAPQKYEMGIAPGMGHNGGNCGTVMSKPHLIIGKQFGTLMQNMSPEKYAGKRIRMTGYMRSEHLAKWASFWLRIDGNPALATASFDNMFYRAVNGTTGWQKYELVMDVPYYTTNIAFGALVTGTGQIWFDDISFEVVGKNIPVTDMYPRDKSVIPKDAEEHAYSPKAASNLDFEQ